TGFLTRQALFQAVAEGQNTRAVGEVMVQVPALPLAAPLSQALDALQQAPAVAATDQSGHMIGYVTSENIGEMMVLRSRK
ncbi:unnamed protein product, partial [Ectocarpus sp. 12 AP-2014]